MPARLWHTIFQARTIARLGVHGRWYSNLTTHLQCPRLPIIRPTLPRVNPSRVNLYSPNSPSGHSSPDRLASVKAAQELESLFPFHVWRLVCVDATYDDVLRQTEAVWRVMQARKIML